MTNEERLKSIANALGLEGSIPSMLLDTIGLTLDQLLTTGENPSTIDHQNGWYAVRTCSRDKFNSIAEENVGNIQFWLGVSKGQWLKSRGI